MRELIISFGANSYIALFEIDDRRTVIAPAILISAKKISFEGRIECVRVDVFCAPDPLN